MFRVLSALHRNDAELLTRSCCHVFSQGVSPKDAFEELKAMAAAAVKAGQPPKPVQLHTIPTADPQVRNNTQLSCYRYFHMASFPPRPCSCQAFPILPHNIDVPCQSSDRRLTSAACRS